MQTDVDRYRGIVGDKVVDRLYDEASHLAERHIVHVNSTYYGGGVAELLGRLVPLMNEMGIRAGWRLLKGSPDFFMVTKQMHDGLQGAHCIISKQEREIYEETNRTNALFTHFDHHDLVMVHDPQPLPLITHYRKRAPWIWRCHIDLSNPNRRVWKYLRPYVLNYKTVVVSAERFKQRLPQKQHVIAPSIDPLSRKNAPLRQSVMDRVLEKYGIPQDKPLITQVSRFDRWKDPWGVIDAFHLVRKKVKCRLVLLGEPATDDPDGKKIFEGVLQKAEGDRDIHIISVEDSTLVNAVQRASAVVLQKSLKEGFALTVSEALWKGTPVVAGNVGGIPLQVWDGYNGYLVDSVHDCAARVVKLLKNPALAAEMGRKGHEHVRQHFLLTRQLMDDLQLFRNVLKGRKVTHRH